MLSLANLGYGGQGFNDRLPAILAELQGHTISGPYLGAAANTPIAIPNIDFGDTLQKVLVFTAGVPSDQTVNASIVDRRAKGTITLLSTITNGDVIKVNGKSYTFKSLLINPSVNIAPYVVPIILDSTKATDLEATAEELAVTIMSSDSTLTCFAVGASVTVQSQAMGMTGNTVPLDVTLSNTHVTASGVNLAGGTESNAIVITTSTVGGQVMVFWFKKSTV